MQAKLDHLERLVSQQQRELASLRNSSELRAAIRPPSGRRPSSAGAARQLASVRAVAQHAGGGRFAARAAVGASIAATVLEPQHIGASAIRRGRAERCA